MVITSAFTNQLFIKKYGGEIGFAQHTQILQLLMNKGSKVYIDNFLCEGLLLVPLLASEVSRRLTPVRTVQLVRMPSSGIVAVVWQHTALCKYLCEGWG